MRAAPCALMRRDATELTDVPLIGAAALKAAALVSDIGALKDGVSP
jgi:hypothetical protein